MIVGTMIAIWFMLFYLGFRLIDIRHDLKQIRQRMERISK